MGTYTFFKHLPYGGARIQKADTFWGVLKISLSAQKF